MIFYYIFLLNSLNAKLTLDFKFPDPIRDRETPFCPIDPLLTTNAEVRCTNSAFRASLCTYICLKPGYALVNEAGYRIRNQLFCKCNGLDCEWEGQAYDGKCRDYDEYRLNIQKEVNHVVMKKYFTAIAVPVNLKIAKFAGGLSSKRVKKKVKKLKRLVEKKIPKTDNEITEFIDEGKRNNNTTMVMDIPINVFDLERGLQQEYNGNCKPLTLRFGTVECSDGFHKGSECKHKCKDGYGLHRMSPAARTCVCTKWGCVWMRKAKAKCQKETKAGRRKHKVALPWCVHISDGKKVLIRNRHCMCPS